MPEYVVSTVFKGHNDMGKVFDNLTSNVSKFETRTKSSFANMQKSAIGLKTVMGGILSSSAVLFGIGKIKQGIAAVTENIIGFDQALVSAGSKLNVERGTKEFKELGTAIRDVAAVTPFTAAETGKALDYLAMAGFNLRQSMANLPVVTQLGIAGEMDLARASDIASDALSALGLMTSDDQQLAKNLTRIGDVFTKTANTANTNVDMLWESFKPAGSVITQLGGSLEYGAAMFGKLASSGIKAEMAGTALRNMYLRLTSGTSEVDKVLKKYNITIMDSKGKLLPLMDILEQAKVKFANLNDKEKQANLTHLFGLRAVNASMILMDSGKKSIDEYTKSLENAGGEMERVAKIKGQSLQNRIAAIKSKFVEAGIKIYDVMEKDILAGFRNLENWIQNFDAKEFTDWIKNTYNDLKTLATFIGKVTKPIIEFAELGSSIGVGLDDIAAGFLAFKVATLGAAAAATAFNVAGGPIVWTITGIGIAGYEMYKHWDEIAGWMDNLWKEIAYGFMWLLNVVSFGNLEAIAGKQAAATFRAMDEMKRRALYKKSNEQLTEEDLKGLYGEEKTSGVFGNSVEDIFSKYGVAADIDKEKEYARQQELQVNNFAGELLYGKPESSELNINFTNPPAGMTSSIKQGRNAPKINNNLGKYLK